MSSICFGQVSNHYYVGTYSSVAGEKPLANYDADTLELITMEMLLGENWRQYMTDGEDDLFYVPSEWWSIGDGTMTRILAIAKREEDENYHWIQLKVPNEAVNSRYLPAD